MIVFQVSLNFDPAEEILKIRCQIYILISKVIILKKCKHNKAFRSTIPGRSQNLKGAGVQVRKQGKIYT